MSSAARPTTSSRVAPRRHGSTPSACSRRRSGLERIELYMALDRPLTPSELDVARELVVRRGAREPLQYVLGEWGFRRLTLTVDPRALIPRPETEILVDRALALVAGRDAPRVLDVGTGSGSDRPRRSRTSIRARSSPGSTLSADALALAAENAARTGLAVELLQDDLFDGLPGGPWDLVVSNPPYVDAERRPDRSQPEVRDWEPHEALTRRRRRRGGGARRRRGAGARWRARARGGCRAGGGDGGPPRGARASSTCG